MNNNGFVGTHINLGHSYWLSLPQVGKKPLSIGRPTQLMLRLQWKMMVRYLKVMCMKCVGVGDSGKTFKVDDQDVSYVLFESIISGLPHPQIKHVRNTVFYEFSGIVYLWIRLIYY